MKKFSQILILAATITTFASCKKDITGATDALPALNPANTDKLAGTWKTILIGRPDTFAVAAPNAINSPAYQADIQEILQLQSNVNAGQTKAIQYWGAGNILRWNEIMRELVARHNIPPYQNADGTYPTPSANNPFAYPSFPFSTPPYAARAYAYVSAAQYDALVACYHFKNLYNIAQPYNVNNAVQCKISKTTLPSYPSEAAVTGSVTLELMKLLFPTETERLQEKYEEQKLAALASGAATRNDITAGELLGKQVAQVFIARAKIDGAGAAVGTAADWAALETNTIARGEVPWKSLELPARPPMLPMFGNVKPFLFSTGTVSTLRAIPPPSTSSAQFATELKEVAAFAKNPSKENMRIVQFWSDGVNTYTPPGHWNYIAAQDFIQMNFSEARWARNMALLNMAMMDAAIVCWHSKYFYFSPRPTQIDPSIKTLTGIPNFPAYISGHSTFSAAAAEILGYINPAKSAQYMQMADEASRSRLYGAIHYRSDCEQGLKVGKNVGAFAIGRARVDGA